MQKIWRMVKSLRPVKIRRMVKSLRPVKILRIVKSLHVPKIWQGPKTRRVPKTQRGPKTRRVPKTRRIRKSGQPYCIGSAESATADIFLDEHVLLLIGVEYRTCSLRERNELPARCFYVRTLPFIVPAVCTGPPWSKMVHIHAAAKSRRLPDFRQSLWQKSQLLDL